MRPLLVLLALSLYAPLAASAGKAGNEVAVLPLSTPKGELSIYRRPVAIAIATALRRSLRTKVRVLSDGGSVSRNVGWIVDGSIVKVGQRVSLEARVRDPELGKTVARVRTKPGSVTKIDKLAAALATDLTREIERARARRKAERERVAKDPLMAPPDTAKTAVPAKPAVAGPASKELADLGTGAVPVVPVQHSRPTIVVPVAIGTAAGGSIEVGPAATRAAAAWCVRNGYRPVMVGVSADASGDALAAAVSRAGASYALALVVKKVDYSWSGVLTARGSVQVILWTPGQGNTVDRRVRTGTVVGSRGDRHGALVGLVAEQALDIVTPETRRALARAAPPSARVSR